MSTNTTAETKPAWTFLTNHFHVLVVLARNEEARIRDIAEEVGITQRAVQRIIAELLAEEVINVVKVGRRNTYTLNNGTKLKHPLESRHTVGEILALLT